LNRFLLPFICY